MEKVEFNEAVAGWARVVKNRMLQRVAALTLKDKRSIQKRQALKAKGNKSLAQSIGFGLKRSFGEVDRVNFKMAIHGIFFERGVGRSRKAGSGSTNPRPFIADNIDPALDELATIISEHYADTAIEEIKFSLPGIANRRVKITTNG